MKILLLLLGLLAAFFCVDIFANAKSAVHEIEALIACLITACCFGFFGVISAVQDRKG